MRLGERMTVLILGGTATARDLADRLAAAGIPAVSSLAGRTSEPRLPAGPVRSGGFGGPEGLALYLREHRIAAIVDATHPFAAQMTEHAVRAAAMTGTPVLLVTRPGWSAHPHAPTWTWVDGHRQAAATAKAFEGPVLLTVGRQSLPSYVEALGERSVVARVADPSHLVTPPDWQLVVARGPFEMNAERNLLRDHGCMVLVSKDSGGTETAAKLDAAHELGVRVIMVRRPATPAGVDTTHDLDRALAWCRRTVG